MSKPTNITETQLIRLIEDEIEIEPEDSYGDELLTPEEIVGLMEDQIVQLQGRVDYSEELLADVVEFTSSLMSDLGKSEDLNLRRSKQKFRALETRAGREMFWIQSRRL